MRESTLLDTKTGEGGMIPRLTRVATFEDPAIEQAYRQQFLSSDGWRLRIACLIVVLAVCVFFINDVRLLTGTESDTDYLFGLRLSVIVVALFTGSIATTLRRPKVLDASSLIFALFASAAIVMIDASRPPDYFGHLGADIVAILGIYLVLPMPQTYRFIAAGALTASLLALHYIYKVTSDDLTTNAVLLSLILANALGALYSSRYARTHRSEYILLRATEEAREKLQNAFDDIRTLSGLIPICADCKKVRTDEGFWEQVEVFVRQRSGIEFTHGLCPDCTVKYKL